MALTLRLKPDEEAELNRLAAAFHTSRSGAAVAAIGIAAPKADHPDFVATATRRLLGRYADLLARLASV